MSNYIKRYDAENSSCSSCNLVISQIHNTLVLLCDWRDFISYLCQLYIQRLRGTIFFSEGLIGKILFWSGLLFTAQQRRKWITTYVAGKFCSEMNVNGKQMNLPMHTHDLCTVNTNSYTRISWCKNSTCWCGTTYASQTDNACCRLFAVASLWTVTHRLNLSPLPFPPAPSHPLSCGLTN